MVLDYAGAEPADKVAIADAVQRCEDKGACGVIVIWPNDELDDDSCCRLLAVGAAEPMAKPAPTIPVVVVADEPAGAALRAAMVAAAKSAPARGRVATGYAPPPTPRGTAAFAPLALAPLGEGDEDGVEDGGSARSIGTEVDLGGVYPASDRSLDEEPESLFDFGDERPRTGTNAINPMNQVIDRSSVMWRGGEGSGRVAQASGAGRGTLYRVGICPLIRFHTAASL